MTSVLAQVSGFVLTAFALGVGVGWAFWRYRRVSVAVADWRALSRELDRARAHLDEERRRRDELAAQLEGVTAELERGHRALHEAWHDRDAQRRDLHRTTAALVETRSRLEEREGQVRYLQRRVTELSILSARRHPAEVAPRRELGPRVPNGGPLRRGLPAPPSS